uniref:NADH-ubiquinone oxidoreductase chain 4L n=1 Tax=Hemisphaerius rufovarius TaxID=1897809 RepID=A0A6M4AIM9_9HEMI|nr:NADH dehydrogenase subunit 4L [Hemisphaerius rufovarius]
MFMGFLMYFSGLIGLIFVRKHFLLSLLMLEFTVLSMFYYFYIYFFFFGNDYYFCLILLVLGVCEGVIGLSLLVFLSRSSSMDYLSNLSLC